MLLSSLSLVQKSATKMRDELAGLLEIFHKVEEAGGKATISITTSLGVTKTKLEIVSPTPGSSNATSSSSPSAPGNQAAGRRRRRHRGARARARRNQRAAAHQTSLAEAAASVSLVPPLPLRLLPSPPPESGRRRVVSCVGRLELPSFNNLDGAPPSSPPCSPPPTPSRGWPPASTEGEDVVIDVGECVRDNGIIFSELYEVPPAKVRSSKPELGIGSFLEIDKHAGNFVNRFENDELWEF